MDVNVCTVCKVRKWLHCRNNRISSKGLWLEWKRGTSVQLKWTFQLKEMYPQNVLIQTIEPHLLSFLPGESFYCFILDAGNCHSFLTSVLQCVCVCVINTLGELVNLCQVSAASAFFHGSLKQRNEDKGLQKPQQPPQALTATTLMNSEYSEMITKINCR